MAEFIIKDVGSSTTLQFEGDIPRGLTGYDGCSFMARINSHPLSAAVNVYDIRPDRWAAFFSELASNWRGWEGTKAHQSLEGHFGLEASSDSLGHIRLSVFVCGVEPSNYWRAETRINLEAGQLESLAAQANSFFG